MMSITLLWPEFGDSGVSIVNKMSSSESRFSSAARVILITQVSLCSIIFWFSLSECQRFDGTLDLSCFLATNGIENFAKYPSMVACLKTFFNPSILSILCFSSLARTSSRRSLCSQSGLHIYCKCGPALLLGFR